MDLRLRDARLLLDGMMTRRIDPNRSCWILALLCLCALGWSDAHAQDEEAFTLDDALGSATDEATGDSFLDSLKDNLRIDIDFISRVEWTNRRNEFAFTNAIGLDIRKVLSNDSGDIGTILLQPYIVRRDNMYNRMVPFNGDDEFVIELHDFYFNFTRWGRGRTNIKVGHFDVPFGLEPIVDTHWTLRQYQPMMNVGFKKDWGISLNGSLPDFDYEVSLTRGVGMDFSEQGRDPYLVAGRIGTPSDRNTIFGVSALYGEVTDEHGGHRYDEGGPDFREIDKWVRRYRVGVDATHIMGQFTMRGEVAAGKDFDHEIVNSIGEIAWTDAEDTFDAYVQVVFRNQNGHLGWDEDVHTRLGFVWRFHHHFSISGQWIHEFETYAQETGADHNREDSLSLQLRVRY